MGDSDSWDLWEKEVAADNEHLLDYFVFTDEFGKTDISLIVWDSGRNDVFGSVNPKVASAKNVMDDLISSICDNFRFDGKHIVSDFSDYKDEI